MYPHERSLVNTLADKPFVLIGVNSDEDLQATREAVKEKNLNWRSFWNGENGTAGPISKEWQIRAWPTIFVLDAEGRIRFKGNAGPELDTAIVDLLAEMGHDVDVSELEEKDEAEEDDK